MQKSLKIKTFKAHGCFSDRCGGVFAAVFFHRFGLASGEYLTNAGEILFGSTRPIPLKVGIFATDEKLTILDMQLYKDNIFNLLNIVEKYILKNLHWKSEITDMMREDIPEIPIAVIN